MNTGWTFETIGKFVEAGQAEIQTGPFGTQLKASDYVEEGTPVINVRNLGFGEVRTKNLEYLNDSMVFKLRVHKLEIGDIVFGRKGAVERHALIDAQSAGWIQGSDCLRLRFLSPFISQRFVSYYFCTASHQHWMQAVCSFGATMSSLNQDLVKRISFPCPPLYIQQKIVAVLSAYDELISNTNRRIKVIEDMADNAFKEWFLRFRFPGYKNAPFNKGIPVGWNDKWLNEIYEINYGRDLPTTQLEVDGEFPVYGAGDIIGRFHRSNCLQRVALVTCRGNGSGTVWHTNDDESFVTNTSLMITPVNRERSYYYFDFLHLKHSPIATAIGGAAQPQITISSLSKTKIRDIPKVLVGKFSEILKPLDTQRIVLLKTVDKLRAKRKLLLNRLVFGKLPVAEIDIQFPSTVSAPKASTCLVEAADT